MKIGVLVSGGVDSSVALQLLKNQGHDVTAFYLKIWLEDELSYLGDCPWQEDLEYVRLVCDKLEVPLEIVSLQKAYHERVVAYTVAEVKAGRTPNPDVLCNRMIKFGVFWDHVADKVDYVASGHYAQLIPSQAGMQLMRAPDDIKDQTYFLAYMTSKQLSRTLFPIGHLNKQEVRALAHQFELPNRDRKDSQGICFLGKLKFRDFVRHYVGESQGEIKEFETGNLLGNHQGFWFYTIGQRQGIGLSGGPWYVVQKDIEHNIVFVSRNYYADDKERFQFIVGHCNWISAVPTEGETVQVKLRHGAQIHQCQVVWQGDFLNVTLQERDQGIAAGQFAVFYRDTICIGSGIIGASGSLR